MKTLTAHRTAVPPEPWSAVRLRLAAVGLAYAAIFGTLDIVVRATPASVWATLLARPIS